MFDTAYKNRHTISEMLKLEKMEYATSWETLDEQKVADTIQTTQEGITTQEAQRRSAYYGLNVLPPPKRKSSVVRFMLQFHNALIYVLIAAAVLKLIMALVVQDSDHWVDMGVILGVIIINAIIGFIQENKAQKALDAIGHMLSPKATVLRDGVKVTLEAENLTIGDVVYLKAGDKVPADMRLFMVNHLKVDESTLTGESLAVAKNTHKITAGTALGDRTCMVFAGTSVQSGDAYGYVIAIASDTQLGQINTMLQETRSVTLPLVKKMDKFGKVLSLIILGVSAILLPVAIWGYGMPWAQGVQAIIGLAVAAIPEGLPSVITIILALGVGRMARKKAIIKKLPSVETLGSVTVICSDKTGTLTQNEMTVTDMYTQNGDFTVTGMGYAPTGSIEANGQTYTHTSPELYSFLQCAALCSEASLVEKDGMYTPVGAPTEAALVTLAQKSGIDITEAKQKSLKLAEIPFDSQYKYRACLCKAKDKNIVYVNGAPERLLEMCKFKETDSLTENAHMTTYRYWLDKIELAAAKGQRMLGLAYAEVDDSVVTLEHTDLPKINLQFLGIAGIVDPPKPDAIKAIAQAKAAGIKVKMITGDHALTASVIAKQMGITDNAYVLTGTELATMDDLALKDAVQECDIFARTSPADKLRIVAALQARGEIVSMTGDGVNDAPALKKADIGVAMGIKGTDVTRESSEMVLADDNFATIVAAAREGRTIYDNIVKTIIFTLPTSTAQALVIALALLFNFTLPITALQILWVNLVVAVTITIALAFEGAETNVMNRPPRNPKESLVGKYTLFRTAYTALLHVGATIGAFLILYNLNGDAGLAHARTFAINMLAIGTSVLYIFNCRKLHSSMFSKDFFKNKVVFMVCGILFALQIAFTYLPFMNRLFGTAGLSFTDWLIIMGIGLAVMLLVELEKWIVRMVRNRKLQPNPISG